MTGCISSRRLVVWSHKPASATEILEASLVTAEVRALLHATHLAQRICEVWVYLNLREF